MDTNYEDVPTNPNTKIVLVGGCFDILHFGHFSFLQKAKTLGDHLLVLLESDATIKRLKGEGRPFHTQVERKQMLSAISCVDEIYMLPPLSSDQEYVSLLTSLHPSIIALTEGDPIMEKKIQQAELIGAKAVVIPKIHSPSTSQLAKLLGLE